MTGKNDDAASRREDSFLAGLIPQVTENLAERHAAAFDAEAGQARFDTWLGAHTKEPAAPAKDRAGAGKVRRPGTGWVKRVPIRYLLQAPSDAEWLAAIKTRTKRGRPWTIAIPLLIAALVGILISTPIVWKAFQPKISAQITVLEQQRAEAATQVRYWTANVADLSAVANSDGTAPLNPSADPQIESLTKQLKTARTSEQHAYEKWLCELTDESCAGGTGTAGAGPTLQADSEAYAQAQAEVAALTRKVQQRETQLTATDAAAVHARYQLAISALPAAWQQLNSAQAQQNQTTNRLQALNQPHFDPLLDLVIALAALAGSYAMARARLSGTLTVTQVDGSSYEIPLRGWRVSTRTDGLAGVPGRIIVHGFPVRRGMIVHLRIGGQPPFDTRLLPGENAMCRGILVVHKPRARRARFA